jgi:lipopolysaccharide biosynthesis regulator YciM
LNLSYIIFTSILVLVALWLAYFYLKPSKSKHTNSIYTDALNAMLLADKRKAISLLSTVVKQNSNHIDAYLQLGNLLRDEDPDRATKIHQMLTVRPNLRKETKIEILKSLALDFEKKGELLKAKNESEKVLKIDKSNLWATSFLLSIAEKTEDWDYAERIAKELQNLKSFRGLINLSNYTLQKGIKYLNNNEIVEAEILFRKAISESPDFGLPYKYLGDVMHSNRDLVKAVEYWEKYMELEPSNSSSVFDSIETALFDLGRYSEVEKFYRKVLDKNPEDVNAGQRLANVLNEKGENKAAIALVEQFIEKDTFSISVLLMKLKLSLLTKTPSELSHYVDEILERIKKHDA